MENTEIPKVYDPKKVESFWSEFWIKEGLFKPQYDPKKQTFVVVIPPPNVTGSLHMGHALNNTLQDVLVRWKKMCGYETLWVPGTDHGGIATQNVVEKLLKGEKKSRYDLGREKFLERMWQWRKESGDTILMQLRKLGSSLDWGRTRFTMDEVCSQSVLAAFTELFKKGWIYRGKRMVNWCVRCQTALSDIEVEFEERKGKLYHIRYPILSGVKDGWQGVPLIVATTRPETLLGDTAVAVNPEDPRYEKIHGWWVQLPLVEREIAIITDSAVDLKFGTGVVKVTPAHDMVDFEMGERHHLKHEIVIGFDGKMTSEAGKYAGLSREDCREKVLEDLKAQNLLEKVEDYRHSIGICYRCNTPIEPLVSDQWFLKVEPMAQKALEATQKGSVKIFPESWSKPYIQWLEGLKDWCISRQIWWGHRIPVWYCVSTIGPEHPSKRTHCAPMVSSSSPEHCSQCNGTQLEQDPDVLDTWFSSALWPFSVFGWPKETQDLKRYYPTALLVTGHEILYLWVARMVMMGTQFMGCEPFSHVFIHGIVRDKQGKKMSKSLGNVIDPLTIMEKFGTDALRYALTSQSVPGRDMQISEDAFTGARNFANKIWNVSRFVQIYLKQEETIGFKPSLLVDPKDKNLELCDRWILSRFQKTVQIVNQGLEEYNLALSARTLYQFIWSEFCDWYVELSKIRLLQTEDKKKKETALNACVYLLDGILRLAHPVMPFLSEEIFKSLGSQSNVSSLLLMSYPTADLKYADESAESKMRLVMDIVTEVRTLRSEMDVPPAKRISLYLNSSDPEQRAFLQESLGYIEHLCRVDHSEVGDHLKRPPKSATLITHGVEIFVPLEGLIDFEKERQRLLKELELVQKELGHVEQRLSDPKFRTNAPQEEVSKTEERKLISIQKLEKLKMHMALVQ